MFDECKNKLGERKSWASSDTAKEANAAFLCLAHNLMVLLEAKLETEEQATNEAERSRRLGRAVERCRAILRSGARPDYVTIALERLTVRSVKFVRWLRSFVCRETPWSEAIARLRRIYATL